MNKNSSILKVNTKNLLKNYYFFRRKKNNLIVAVTIKANAYGLGFFEIFKIFKNIGCKHFFVATLEEGLKIKNKDKNTKIYILNGIQDNKLKIFKDNNLIPIINTHKELQTINRSDINFGLHIDTGLNRLGIDHNDIRKEIFDNSKIEIVISHLASADESNNKFNTIQKNRFQEIIKKFKSKKIIYSLSNSSGAVLSKSFLFNMIRPGIGIYGGNNNNKLLINNLKPVVQLSAKIIQIKTINKNEYIGYNQTYKTKKQIKIAIIGIGYADGIPRHLGNKGFVYYKNNKFKILGRISMDSITIDITKSNHNLKTGLFIDLINKENGIENFANQCNTISNEVLTNIGERVEKIYD